jgi:hypothetical protein
MIARCGGGKSFSPTARNAGSEFTFGDEGFVGIVWADLESPSPALWAGVLTLIQVEYGDRGSERQTPVSISGGGGFRSSQSGADKLVGYEWISLPRYQRGKGESCHCGGEVPWRGRGGKDGVAWVGGNGAGE